MYIRCLVFQSGKTIKKWTSYFDYVGVDARKPLFFGEGRESMLLQINFMLHVDVVSCCRCVGATMVLCGPNLLYVLKQGIKCYTICFVIYLKPPNSQSDQIFHSPYGQPYNSLNVRS